MTAAGDRVAQIRARAEAATPGPWLWNGNVDDHSMRLSAAHSGRYTVMDLARWGMGSAKARFQIKGRGMVPANELVTYEVCPDAAERTDPRVYRGDYQAINHPDADFIAAARSDIPYLLDQLAEAERNLASVHETMQDALRSNELIREMAAGFMAERDEARRQLAEAEPGKLLDEVERIVKFEAGPGDVYMRADVLSVIRQVRAAALGVQQ